IIALQALVFNCVMAQDESCESCHSVIKPDGDYILQEPLFWVDAPGRVSPNETFKVVVAVTHYGLFDIKNIRAELDLSQVSNVFFSAGENGFKNIQEIGSKAQTQRMVWELKTGNSPGNAEFPIYFNYTLEHIHTTVEEADTYDYQRTLSHTLEIKETPISLSTWLIMADLGESQSHYIEITTKRMIYNVKVVPGRSIKDFTEVEPSDIGTMAQGAVRNITVAITPNLEMEYGQIIITWSTDQEGYEQDSIEVKVSVSEKIVPHDRSSGAGTGTWLWGRVTGFVGLALLIILIPTGGTLKSLARRVDRFIGTARKRVDLHCALSYQMFAIALLHGALLMYGRYSSLAWNGVFLLAEPGSGYINLGFIAVLLLIVISLFGIFQKKLVRKIGYKNWTRVHGWLTFGTLGLVIAHLLLVGTTIGLPLRTVF
ncbi:MAG: ferric reductase-like transmembrane domain-containing protein, partial [Thermoplasmata archaeon]|nr:ferric reductase-like transmembrane domain-containing protein [Thermoplasmata archaeon]